LTHQLLEKTRRELLSTHQLLKKTRWELLLTRQLLEKTRRELLSTHQLLEETRRELWLTRQLLKETRRELLSEEFYRAKLPLNSGVLELNLRVSRRYSILIPFLNPLLRSGQGKANFYQ
jgi:hypothetical protein